MNPNPNPNPKANSKSNSHRSTTNTVKKKSEYELCKVCNLNHDQGSRHKYFPSHKTSLSSFLSRFHNKLTHIRSFLKNPAALRPPNRLWCVFCDADVHDLTTSFACSNAIAHLASEGHLKNLKHFLWKHGGGMDRVDTFRILEADVAKWEKKCQSLNRELASSTEEGDNAPTGEPPNDIHNEYNYGNIDNFQKHDIHPLRSKFPNGVMPLQYYTNEKQVSSSGLSDIANVGYGVASLPAGADSGTNLLNTKYLAANSNDQPPLSNGKYPAASYLSNGGMYQEHHAERMVNGESSSQGLQKLTQFSLIAQGNSEGNVHSGAPPPWFEAIKDKQLDVQLKPVKSSKSNKLNPKRVGAAWAERRKLEMEMEKRGEIVKSNCNADWLPNFGRVWQSGTRKESRKEFEVEKRKLPTTESQSDIPIKIQPYISKRMRGDASG